MKTKHLLAALALPIVFSACNQDELITNNVENEIVGTPIGYDLNFNASFDGASTRLNNKGWELGDKISMGWISAAGLTASTNLFSNHPIFCKDVDGVFKSETMIYEGLYIASYPFQSTQKIAPLVFDLAAQKSEESYLAGRYHVSDKFFTLDEETAGLAGSVELNLKQLTNLMKLNIKLAAGAALPEDFKITGVTLTDAGAKLVNELTLAATNAAVATGNSTLATAAWTAEKGNIVVSVGGENGAAVDATKGLDVYVQMGAFASDDATTLTIHTNYGDAEIVSGSNSVAWSSPAKYLNQIVADQVDDFKAAVVAMNGKATGKEYGQNVSVDVTLDDASLTVPTVVTSQADLDKIVAISEALGNLKEGNSQDATITFSKSTLLKKDGIVTNDGDVIITDFSGLNKFGGAITFAKAGGGAAPTNVYVSGDIALKATPTITSVSFDILKDQTLTISEDLDLGSNTITVAAGATLINKAALAGGSGTASIAAAVVATSTTPAIPAGKYISKDGASATINTFTNNGEVVWEGGALPAGAANSVTATVTTLEQLFDASTALNLVANGSNIVTISGDVKFPTQLSATGLAGIKGLIIDGNVEFGLTKHDKPFDFSDLVAITIKKGSLSLTGGNAGTAATDFCTLGTATDCSVTLTEGTSLTLAAGTKLDLGSGTVTYTKATVTNNGFIDGSSSATSGNWSGNAAGDNPKQ